MTQRVTAAHRPSLPENRNVTVIGAGIVGLCCAYVLSSAGCAVRLIAASNGPDDSCCSWWAGGMLAPYCEGESADPAVVSMGIEGLAFWRKLYPELPASGTLVVAPARDVPDLRRFSNLTERWQRLDQSAIAALEPDLAGRFSTALYFSDESFFDPRFVLPDLVEKLRQNGVAMEFGLRIDDAELSSDSNTSTELESWTIDCRGLAARDQLPDLRGVKGEMLVLRCADVSLQRPIRLLHPRVPVYIVPREQHQYMIGASMLENDERERATVRSVMELLSAAVVVHPAFAEAEILEIGVDARPAFPDNCPRVVQRDRVLYANGTFRHGYLVAPALARQVSDIVCARVEA